MDNLLNENLSFENMFLPLSDEIFVVDTDGNIKFRNVIANKLYPNITNIKKISHIFDFEICILKNDDIMSFSPIVAALSAKENFFSNITKQINSNNYTEYNLFAINYSNNLKIIVLKNISTQYAYNNYSKLETKTIELEKQIIQDSELKTKLENNLLRTNLFNLLSDKVREYIDTNKIIKIVIEQLKKTLDISDVKFNDNIENLSKKIVSETDNDCIKLIVPVYDENKIYGALVILKKSILSSFQKEEVDLIKNIASLLSTAFAKEELYNELKKQKKELENALVQLKEVQLQIVQAEKMAALGKLVAGVAHEINTPLGAIRSNFDLLKTVADSETNKSELSEILLELAPVSTEALRRIENLVKSLKNFTRLDEAQKKKVDIHEGLKSTIDLISHEIKNRIEIKTDYDNNIPQISCYPDYINQVFMNILLNACQSIQDKGEINIKTELKDDFVLIKISDNGSGIEKNILQKIFDFGFTTKKIGQGTGLGLALAKKIIDEHKGKIEVESFIGQGTIFKIYLPIK